MKAASVTTEEGGRVSQEVVFPWAVVNYKDRSEVVPLLRNQLGASQEDRINRSIQNLEYAFADARLSFIQPIFHLKPKPRPPASTGRETPGQAVVSSATIMMPG